MMSITYENAADQMTVQDAIELYEVGIATIITDGRDVTFEAELVSTSKERNMERH
jgi:phage baseplate assembly protein gpV